MKRAGLAELPMTHDRRLTDGAVSLVRRVMLFALLAAALAGCAALAVREPVRVTLAGLEPISGAGLEARFLATIRVQNPNDTPIAYDGVAVEVELNGRSFASGVGDAKGEVPRFGESLVTLPVTVPASAIVRQVLAVVGGDRGKATYRVHGFLSTGMLGRVPFESSGAIELFNTPASG